MAKHRDNKPRIHRYKVSAYKKLINNRRLEWCIDQLKEYIERNKNKNE